MMLFAHYRRLQGGTKLHVVGDDAPVSRAKALCGTQPDVGKTWRPMWTTADAPDALRCPECAKRMAEFFPGQEGGA